MVSGRCRAGGGGVASPHRRPLRPLQHRADQGVRCPGALGAGVRGLGGGAAGGRLGGGPALPPAQRHLPASGRPQGERGLPVPLVLTRSSLPPVLPSCRLVCDLCSLPRQLRSPRGSPDGGLQTGKPSAPKKLKLDVGEAMAPPSHRKGDSNANSDVCAAALRGG